MVGLGLESIGHQRLHRQLLLVPRWLGWQWCNCASTKGSDFASMSNMMESSQVGPTRIREWGRP